MEQAYAADAYCADGISVIGIFQGDEPGPIFLAEILVILIRCLKCDLYARCAAVGVKDFFQGRWCNFDEFFGKFNRSCLAQAQECTVAYFIKLCSDGVIDFFYVVAVDIAPH